MNLERKIPHFHCRYSCYLELKQANYFYLRTISRVLSIDVRDPFATADILRVPAREVKRFTSKKVEGGYKVCFNAGVCVYKNNQS